MALTSRISTYDPKWPSAFEAEARRIHSVPARSVLTIHHVGSTAVPDLMAKPEIDLLAVVESVVLASEWTLCLDKLGYRRGGDLAPGHLFYKRDVEEVRTHKLHVLEAGHADIDRMLRFRDRLRSDRDVRQDYQALKLRLEAENAAGIREYLSGKAEFVEKALDMAD